jgi:signal transduction histidine kinase
LFANCNHVTKDNMVKILPEPANPFKSGTKTAIVSAIRTTLGELLKLDAVCFSIFLPEDENSDYANRDIYHDENPVSQDLLNALSSRLIGEGETAFRGLETSAEDLPGLLPVWNVKRILSFLITEPPKERGWLICGINDASIETQDIDYKLKSFSLELSFQLRSVNVESRHYQDSLQSRNDFKLEKNTRLLAERRATTLERELKQAQFTGNQAARLKDEFLSSVSHELRTPLNAIQGYTRIVLRDDNLTERQRISLERVMKSSRNQLKLINSILELSKLESGRMQLDLEQIDMAALINDVVLQVASLAEEQGIALLCEIEAENTNTIADRAKMERIMINLVGNSLKFTQKGSVTLNLSQSSGTLMFSVIDTGIGIPEEEIHTIFESFRQGEKQGSTHQAGTGLGLAITTKLVKLHGGKIDVTSTLGKGSTFIVRIPQLLDLKTARHILNFD